MAGFDLETVLPCSYEEAAREVKTTRLFLYVTSPMLVFEPANETVIPRSWENKTYWFRLKLFGLVPFGIQAVSVTISEESEVLNLRDNGHSRLIRRWDHLVTICRNNGDTVYRDTLEFKAGFMTPFVWLFVRVFFAHRQKRWRRLASSGFRYADV